MMSMSVAQTLIPNPLILNPDHDEILMRMSVAYAKDAGDERSALRVWWQMHPGQAVRVGWYQVACKSSSAASVLVKRKDKKVLAFGQQVPSRSPPSPPPPFSLASSPLPSYSFPLSYPSPPRVWESEMRVGASGLEQHVYHVRDRGGDERASGFCAWRVCKCACAYMCVCLCVCVPVLRSSQVREKTGEWEGRAGKGGGERGRGPTPRQ